MKYLLNNSKFQIIALIILFVLIGIYFEYPAAINLQPQSLHNWRQADCAAFARIYYENGMHFFEPKVYNILAGEGHAVGEFPILYFFIALLYKIFGPHDFIFRIVNITIFMFGLVALFNITKRILKDSFYAILLPLLLFSSPLIMFFTNGFLADIAALSFALIAWDFILKYRDDQKKFHFYLSILFFTISALLKLNAYISFIAIAALYFIELNNWNIGNRNKIFNHKKENIFAFAISFILVSSWYLWAIHYNDLHKVTFLGTKVWPNWASWDTTDERFLSTINGFFANAPYLFFLPTVVLIIVLLVFTIRNKNASDLFLFQSLKLVLIGTLIFIFTFFYGIKDNIYYTLGLYIFPILIILNALYIFKRKYSEIISSRVFKFLVLIFVMANIAYAKTTNKDFYHGGKWHYVLNENFYHPNFRHFIDSIGIEKNDKVISIPDITPNVSLYAIGRQGWSEYNNLKDTNAINNMIRAGAKYLIVSNPGLISTPLLENYTLNYYSNFNNIYIFKLSLNCKNTRNRNLKIKTASGKYLTYFDENASELLLTDSTNAKSFYMIDVGNGVVGFKTINDRHLACNIMDERKLFVNTTWFGNWESFIKEPTISNTNAIKTQDGKYLNLNTENNSIWASDQFNDNSLVFE